jgi:hypothetical protein
MRTSADFQLSRVIIRQKACLDAFLANKKLRAWNLLSPRGNHHGSQG